MDKTKILAFYQSQAGLVVEEMKILMNVLRVNLKKEWKAGWLRPKRAVNCYTVAQSRRDRWSWVHTRDLLHK